jgi:hypothetical protein
MLVKSSRVLQGFPEADGVGCIFYVLRDCTLIDLQLVSWLPGDTVAQVIRDASLLTDSPPPCMNLTHPRKAQWQVLLRAMATAANSDEEPKFIPFLEWVKRLESSAEGAQAKDMQNIVRLRFLTCRRF